MLLLSASLVQLGAAFQMPARSAHHHHDTRINRKHQHRQPANVYRMAADDDMWAQQKELVAAMQGQETSTKRQELQQQYDKRATGLVAETAYVTALIFPLLWLVIDNPLFPLSYLLGATFGLAYTYGLGKFVGSIGGTIDDSEAIQGAGVGQARFAFLIALFIIVGKFKGVGLEPLPCIGGFFTYQIASLTQGLKEYND